MAGERYLSTPLASFGGHGTGDGQFNEPAGIAVNDTAIIVVDTGNNRVQEFTAAGAYSRSSTVVPGRLRGCSRHQYVAVDNSENALDPSHEDVYVADNGHKVVDQFTAAGAYVGH